jgi:hypothetical protein
MNTLDKKKIIFEAKRRKLILKGHGNEADFLGFLQKLVPHRSLTLPFEPFRFWLRIRGDIRNKKTNRRLGYRLQRPVLLLEVSTQGTVQLLEVSTPRGGGAPGGVYTTGV